MERADRFNQRKNGTEVLKLNIAIMNLSRGDFKILETCRLSITVTT